MFEYNAKIKNVIDGDTVDLVVDLGFGVTTTVRVRLDGLNAAEIFGAQKNTPEYVKGKAAKSFIIDFARLTNDNVKIKAVKAHGVYFAQIEALEGPFKGKNLNHEMVESGFASKIEEEILI